MILRLAQGVTIEPMYAGDNVDCRLLFMGEIALLKLARAYPGLIHRLSRSGAVNLPLIGRIFTRVRRDPQIQRH